MKKFTFAWLNAPGFALALIIAITLAAPTLYAQDETSPASPCLTALLDVVPDGQPPESGYIGFSDFRAAEQTRAGAGQFTSWAEAEAADADDDSPAYPLWLNSLPGSGLSFANYLLVAGPDLPAVMGFDFFDVDCALTFGQPPADADILYGRFDATAIDAAMTADGFVRDEQAGFPRWCSTEGCDQGLRLEIQGRQIARLFGGEIGRRQPTMLAGNFLYSAAPAAIVSAITLTHTDDLNSLAENRYYRTVVSAFSSQPDALLRQAYMVDGLNLSTLPVGTTALLSEVDPEQALADLNTSLGDLPMYRLFAVGDLADADQQYAMAVLVYDREADAQAALAVIPARLAAFVSLRTQQPLIELFTLRGAAPLDPVMIADEATGKFAVVFIFSYPQATAERDEFGLLTRSGRVYEVFLELIFSRDTLWLASEVE